MQQILYVVFVGKAKLFCAFPPVGQWMHGATQPLNNHQDHFIYAVRLGRNKSSSDLAIVLGTGGLAYREHPPKPKVAQSILRQRSFNS